MKMDMQDTDDVCCCSNTGGALVRMMGWFAGLKSP